MATMTAKQRAVYEAVLGGASTLRRITAAVGLNPAGPTERRQVRSTLQKLEQRGYLARGRLERWEIVG